MDYGERMTYILLGCFIGFVLGYVVRSLREIKEEVDEIVEIKREGRPAEPTPKNPNDRGSFSWEKASRLSLFVVVAVTVWAAFVSQKASNDVQENYEQDQVARCQSGVDSREVQRQTVEAIYTLATGSLQRDADSPPLTDIELRQYNAYIDRVNAFREDMYKKIKPSKACKPYVDDDRVKPPTPPYPPMTREDVQNE